MNRITKISFLAIFLNMTLISNIYAAGAISFNYTPPSRAFGFSVGSGDMAKQNALNECGSGCGVEVFTQACGALAFGTAQGSPTNAKIVGKGFGDAKDQASNRALAECEINGGIQCAVVASGCE